jgi:hypothetical protein
MPGWRRLTGEAWLKPPKNNDRHLTVFFTERRVLLLFISGENNGEKLSAGRQHPGFSEYRCD